MEETLDEKIDGPRVVAHILNRMPAEKKRALLNRISVADPSVFKAISENIVNFEDIISFTDAGIQRLIKEIPHAQLVMALHSAPKKIIERLFINMSSTKKRLVFEDLNTPNKPIKLEDVQEAQRQICILIDRLRTIGAIISRSDEEEMIY